MNDIHAFCLIDPILYPKSTILDINSVVFFRHYNDIIMGAIASQITSLTIVYSAVYSDADHRKHQSSASLAFVWRIHRWPVNSPHKWPVTRKMFPLWRHHDRISTPVVRQPNKTIRWASQYENSLLTIWKFHYKDRAASRRLIVIIGTLI